MNKENNLVWIDLEMTGLNSEVDVILEIATIITDINLNVLEQGPDLVIHQPDEILESMHEWSKEQHGKTGLTKSVQTSTTTLEQAEQKTFAIIKKYCDPQTAMFAGNTVWQDRIFLKKYMPNIVHYMHYKLIDVSSVQQLVQGWYSKNKQAEFKKAETHRALDDINESIAELKHYRKYFFISE